MLSRHPVDSFLAPSGGGVGALRRPSAAQLPPTCSKPPVHQVHLRFPVAATGGKSLEDTLMSLVLQPWPRGSTPALNTLQSGHWLTWDSPSGGLGGKRPGFLPADL